MGLSLFFRTRVFQLACAGLLVATSALAPAAASATETIVKASLFDGGVDVAFDGVNFGTISDGVAGTIGDQNTRVDFLGALNAVLDINDPVASFSLDGVALDGLASLVGPVVVQATSGGVLSLWDSSNTLLLSAALGNGAITGSVTAETGSFFNVSLMTFTGGSLAPLLDPNSAGISFALSGIFGNGGLGLQVVNGVLMPFQADGLVALDGSPAAVPEPMSALLLLAGSSAALVRRRMNRAE